MNQTDDRLLRTLDVADSRLTDAERARAAVTLERVLATDPGTAGQLIAASPRRGPRPLLLAGAAVALAVAAVVLPGPGGNDDAYASWTATPTLVDPDEVGAAAVTCRDQLKGSSLDVDRAELVLAERRGELVVLLYRTDDPDMSGSCFVQNPRGTDDVQPLGAAVGGSSGPALAPPSSGYTQGALHSTSDMSITDGAVGAEVTGVTIHAGDLEVEASVSNGRYVAWWPGPAHRTGSDGRPEVVLTFDLTLVDGTVLRDVEPSRPS